MMMHSDLLKRLLPPVAYDSNGPVITAELHAEGSALDEAMRNADLMLNESDPRVTVQLFSDWERVAGLPDSCSATLSLSIEQRQVALAAKLALHGGQSRAYFIAMAAKFGYPGATITEFSPLTCNDTCNDALWSEADRFAWQINLHSLLAGNAQLECAIRKFSPAHTTPVFAYV